MTASLGSAMRRLPPHEPLIDPAMILDNLPDPVLVLDRDRAIAAANPAAEQLFSLGRSMLVGRPIGELLPAHSPLLALLEQATGGNGSISEYGIELALVRGISLPVDVHVAPIAEIWDHCLLVLHPCSLAQRFDRNPANRNNGRSIAGLAATLAHEVKNPLSGIRGAAQLLTPALDDEDRSLVQLICDETDRICGLIDRMDAFSEPGRIQRRPVNIHQVLEHVRRLAQSGFARHIRFVELYDPSLPEVEGDRDQLIQVFLNLIKNAAEAAPDDNGQITLVTQYQHGFRMTVGAAGQKLELPLAVEVRDNGGGVPQELVEHLFQPFVSTKERGSGLGLSLVAKIVSDHGGMVSYSPGNPGAVFKVRLPTAR